MPTLGDFSIHNTIQLSGISNKSDMECKNRYSKDILVQ